MRLVRFSVQEVARIGALSDGVIAELAGSWSAVLEQFSGGVAGSPKLTGDSWAVADCTLRAPLPDSARPVFCLGMNYLAHQAEANGPLGVGRPVHPVVFVKQPEAMADPDEALALNTRLSAEFDWEVELGVVIGRAGRGIAPTCVHEHVAGYTVVNDVTARDLQRAHVQWFLGKNIRRSSPVGPCVTTADEVAYPPDVAMTLSVNGAEKQHARTADMIFDIDTFVSTVSQYVDLEVGDVFATGTPAGVGFTRNPPEFLGSGDVMVAEIERIGHLRNGVV